MKKLMFFFIALCLFQSGNAQFIKRMADRAKDRLEQKAGNEVDKGVDDATDVKKKEKGKKGDDQSTAAGGEETKTEENNKPESLQAYSKYDFVPGEKVIAFENFSSADVGDFPTRWNTNATAEVVTLNGREGKWLKIQKEGVFHPEFITNLPENFTLEFDLGVNDNWNSHNFSVNFAKLKTPEDFTDYYHYVQWQGDHAVHLELKPQVKNSGAKAGSKILASKDGNYSVNNSVSFQSWNNTDQKFAHVSVWRQKQRLRVYVNGDKIWDLPKAFDATAAYNAITMACQGTYTDGDYYLLGNLRMAIGAPDTRSKLITEGKFVTRGILFDVSKDVIKPESYGTLKDIANVLKENADVRVKIVGHTDSDGEDAKNMELSKKRAEAVKSALEKEFDIDGSRMETDGKGESQPADKNDTPLGKANNRRVEFIKL